MMNMTLYIGKHKARFWFDCGWYRGEAFALFEVSLLDQMLFEEWCWTIFRLRIAKFTISFGVEEVKG